jgi:hypothetical protein
MRLDRIQFQPPRGYPAALTLVAGRAYNTKPEYPRCELFH